MGIGQLPAQLLIKGGTVYDPATGNSTRKDIAIKNGVLVPVKELAAAKTQVIDAKGALVTHGFIDVHAHFREPGREDKETLATGAQAALAGGFTRVCVMPNTEPPIDNPEAVRSLLEKSAGLPVSIHPIGAITAALKGVELAELRLMGHAGAVGFSDDGQTVSDGQLLRNALRYAADLGVPVINHAEDIAIRNEGVMNEGPLSTRLGLPGNPALAEASMVYRDLLMAADTAGRLHVPHVSTAAAVEQIRRFKQRGLAVTAEATPHHLALTDDLLSTFDTRAKVAPPLRSEEDRQAVVSGLKDGTIDCIATDHAPHTVEDKERDMLNAPFGMIGLESAFGVAHATLTEAGMTTEAVIDLLTTGPAKVMNFDLTPIKTGSPVELVVIQPGQKWTFSRGDIYSRSRNTPMLGRELRGRVVAAITARGLFLAD